MVDRQDVTMDDVFCYLESNRLTPEQEARGFGWWVRQAIEDLRNDNPGKALDILEGATSSYTHEQWMSHKPQIEHTEALLKFLEKKFGREGMSHSID